MNEELQRMARTAQTDEEMRQLCRALIRAGYDTPDEWVVLSPGAYWNTERPIPCIRAMRATIVDRLAPPHLSTIGLVTAKHAYDNLRIAGTAAFPSARFRVRGERLLAECGIRVTEESVVPASARSWLEHRSVRRQLDRAEREAAAMGQE